jgi:hypothetical protein
LLSNSKPNISGLSGTYRTNVIQNSAQGRQCVCCLHGAFDAVMSCFRERALMRPSEGLPPATPVSAKFQMHTISLCVCLQQPGAVRVSAVSHDDRPEVIGSTWSHKRNVIWEIVPIRSSQPECPSSSYSTAQRPACFRTRARDHCAPEAEEAYSREL